MKKIQKLSAEEIETAFQESLSGNVMSLCGKVNEIVDALNNIIEDDSPYIDSCCNFMDSNNKPIDLHSMWIGKLCRFWDDPQENCVYGKLDKIRNDSDYKYVCAFDNGGFDSYKFCERVSKSECFDEPFSDPMMFRVTKENRDLKILLDSIKQIQDLLKNMKKPSTTEIQIAEICERTFNKLWKE